MIVKYAVHLFTLFKKKKKGFWLPNRKTNSIAFSLFVLGVTSNKYIFWA